MRMPQAEKSSWIVAVVAAVGVAACGGNSADDHFERGRQYHSEAQVREAVVEYRLALQIDGRRPDIRLKLGEALEQLGERAASVQQYVRAADLLPDDPGVQVRAGEALLRVGAYEDARAQAERALQLKPDAAAQILLGNTLARLQNVEGALAEYQEALALDPDSGSAYARIGAAQLASGRQTEAEASFMKAIEVEPNAVEPRLALANFQWALGRTETAERTLKEALALDPADPLVNRALGMFMLLTDRAADGAPYFEAIAKVADTPTTKLWLADYYIFSRRFDDARRLLTALLPNANAYALAATRLAAVDVAEGYRAEAQNRLRELLERFPQNAPARLLSARLFLVDGKVNEALSEARRLVEQDPNALSASGAYQLLGSIYARLGRRAAAIQAYEEVLRRRARPLTAHLALANLHLQAADIEKARTYADQALAIAPTNPEARAIMVRIHMAGGINERARAALASLRKDYPNHPTVLNLVAADQLRSGQREAARTTYLRVVEALPGNVEALTALLQMDVAAGRANDAVARIEATLKRIAPSTDLLILAAGTYGAASNPERSEDVLKQAIALEPANLRAYGLLGQLYVSQKRLDDAGDQFRQIVDKEPNSVSANTMLGMLFEAQQRIADAERQYQKVLTIDPRAAVAANNLAWIYVSSNRNLGEAFELARTAQQAMPDEPQFNDTLGWVYYKREMTSEAVQHLEMAVEAAPQDPGALYHLGMAYARSGASLKAREMLRRALASSTTFDGVAEARKMLQTLGG